MDRRGFGRVHPPVFTVRVGSTKSCREASSPETLAAVPAALLTFYLHYFYEMIPGVMTSFHCHTPALSTHPGERRLILEDSCYLQGSPLASHIPRLSPGGQWEDASGSGRTLCSVSPSISLSLNLLLCLSIIPGPFHLFSLKKVLQLLCPRKSCRDLTKLPEHSCLMPLEMLQGTCNVHTGLADVTQDPWETCILWVPVKTLGISGNTRHVFLRKLII